MTYEEAIKRISVRHCKNNEHCSDSCMKGVSECEYALAMRAMRTVSRMEEVKELRNKYKELKRTNNFTKRALCDLCIPFRDKYKLSDEEAVGIVNSTYSVEKSLMLIDK